MAGRRKLYRIKFQEKSTESALSVVCETFNPSEIFGLVTLEDLVIKEASSLVVLPDEDEVAKMFKNTEKLHLPFHALLSVEEFYEDTDDEGEVLPLQVVPEDHDTAH